jgi:hypothetical protein
LLKVEDEAVRRYGRRILKQIRGMFETIHQWEELKVDEWERRMKRHRELIVRRA